MPEQNPSSRIISMSYSVRWRRRCASTSFPADSNSASCSSSSARISRIERSIVSGGVM